MPETTLTVKHEAGLHARPLALFVKTVNEYDAEIQVTNLTREKGPVNGASMVQLLLLAVLPEHQIKIEISGNQGEELMAALTELVESNFGEN
jgi:phosphotransferase system HPr (HPr) family protein